MYVGKKFISLIPKMLIISLIIFLALQLLPGDALTRTVSPEIYANMTKAQLGALRENLGLNRPIIFQYFNWLKGILQGNFGYSQVSGSNIASMMMARLPATIELTFWALVVANVLGLVLGFIAAIMKNSAVDYACTAISVVGISVPEFFFGIVFILVFALKLGWLPTGGRMTAGDFSFIDRIPYMIMPVLCLGISLIATLMRYTRSSMLDVLNKDYIKTARSKGLNEVTVNLKHGFRNALIPVMVLLVFRLPILVSGTVVIEAVFNYPGMGSMVLDAISGGDMPVVMITTMVIAAVTLVASCLVDILTAALDPRVRLE
ncbi:MAG: ABC transporter permease [Eubacteriales bacterium]